MKHLSALVLALCLLLSFVGCGSEDTQPPAQPQQTASSVQPTAEQTSSKPQADLPELMESIGEPIALSAEQAEEFYAFLDAQQPEYAFFDLYDFGAALDAWAEMPSYTPAESGMIRSGSLDEAAFLNRVKQNNAVFLAAANGSKYAALPDGEFEHVFSIVCDGIDVLLRWGADALLLDEKLGDLKILATNMPANGMMTHQDTVLAINPGSVEAFQNSSGEADKFEGTILHEVMHLGQICSDGERLARSMTVRVGPCVQWETRLPHALFWEWYVEGGAEHLKMDIRGDTEPSVYEPFVRQLDAMSVALLPTCDPGAVYMQTLNADLPSFFELFGADTAEEQTEIMHMMCALDVALAQPEAFDAAYKEQYGKALEDRMNYSDRQLGAAGLTLSKVFYRQLCDMAAQETSLSEMFSLIAAFETEMSRTVRYQNNTERNRPFIEGYHVMQTAFFEQLATAADMTAEEIRGQYLAWYYSGKAIDTPHLSAERQDWLQMRTEQNAAQFPKRKAICEFAQ